MDFKFLIILVLINSLCKCQRRTQITTQSIDDIPDTYYEDFTQDSDREITSVKPNVRTTVRKGDRSFPEVRAPRQDTPRQPEADTRTQGNSLPKPTAISNAFQLPKWLLFGSAQRSQNTRDDVDYEGFDGWYNNIGQPSLGAVEKPLIRLVYPKYEDGVFQPSGADRPNPILLSETLMKGEIGTKSNTGKTAFFVYFGQQIVEEILDSQNGGCPPEYMNIQIPREMPSEDAKTKIKFNHSTGHTFMPLIRTRYDLNTGHSTNNPRQQFNDVTPWIDGGLVYGTSKGWSDTLRSFEGGTLASLREDSDFPIKNDIRLPMVNPPPPSGPELWLGNQNPDPRPRLLPSKRFFRLGNPRGHENPFLLTMGVIWFRWHNVLAKQISAAHKEWSDEKVFNEARKWVIASHQQIVVNEWLPLLLGYPLPLYKNYDPSIDPQISNIFQSAAFRFGHTLVTAGGIKRNGDCSSVAKLDQKKSQINEKIVRTCNSFWKPIEHLLNGGFEHLIMGLSSQPAEREDNVVVEDIRGSVFGPLEFTRRDLMAINIQRGRDHGLPDYLTTRRELGLNPDMSGKTVEEIGETLWTDVVKRDPNLLKRLKVIYENKTDKIDIWVGGLLETKLTQPGQLFRKVIGDQFRRIRDGDRYWFENYKNGLFSTEEISRLQQLTIYDIIRSITDIKSGEIQTKVFQLPTRNSNPISSECMKAMTDSYECVTDISNNTTETCLSLGAVTRSRVINDNCTKCHTFDYFDGSELSYALSFVAIGVFGIACILALKILADKRNATEERIRKKNSRLKRMSLSEDITLAQEWVDKKEGLRTVQIHCKSSKKCIILKTEDGSKALRSIDLKEVRAVQLCASANRAQDYLQIKIDKEYDLVLQFDSYYDRERFASKIELFLEEIGIGRERVEVDLKTMLSTAYTKEKRQKHLEQFFRVVFSHAFGVNTKERLNVKTAKEVINTELTQFEFADALSMRPDSTFIQQMFALVDKDKNGYISFREFLDMIIIFAKGSADEKAKLMFDMYDVTRSGKLTVDDFKMMIKSMLELANQSISAQQMDEVINSMFRSAGLRSRQELTFADFQKLLGEYKEELGYAELNFDVGSAQEIISSAPKRRQSAFLRANETVIRAYSYFGGTPDPKQTAQQKGKTTTVPSLLRIETQKVETRGPEWLRVLSRVIDEHKLEIFWITIYTAIITFIFIDKAYTYTYLREDGGLRQIAGLGVTLTRGAASVMMFCFSTILLTMCRNIITFMRETFLHRFVPFDGAVSLHKYIAFWGLIMSLIHSIGHAINFYHISTQNPEDISCLFREFYHYSDELPKASYWVWETITGTTGVLLLSLIILMYVFAIQYSRRNIFNAFWATHNLYPFLYILMVLHGLGRVVQSPIFYNFFTIPIVLFTIDRLISVSRKKVEISVIRATLHPSDVTHLEFKRPPDFDYKSGQWVRIACLALSSSEYHPFTLASAPHEDNLSLYIRAVGPFTMNIRQTYDPNTLGSRPYPKLFLDGPYGEGHQDWLKFEVAVLVGGGIGVTPFASILKDIAFKASFNTKIICKKVYFLWVTRTQKHFEWMSDVIRDTEEKDSSNLLRTHIFITQFYEKFDLRTTMLYICERHFQRISNRSLFTGLKAKTHFGRPNFTVFLDSLQSEHPNVSRVGVFSCGPGPMTAGVQQACETLNRREGAIFSHHFENF